MTLVNLVYTYINTPTDINVVSKVQFPQSSFPFACHKCHLKWPVQGHYRNVSKDHKEWEKFIWTFASLASWNSAYFSCSGIYCRKTPPAEPSLENLQSKRFFGKFSETSRGAVLKPSLTIKALMKTWAGKSYMKKKKPANVLLKRLIDKRSEKRSL